MPPLFNPDTNNTLAGLVLLILVIAIPLAAVTSVAILALYRRAVVRTMRNRANLEMTEPAPIEPSASPREASPPPLSITDLDSDTTKNSTSYGLYADLLRGPWRAASVYAVAGLCYAFVTTLLFLRATKTGFHPLSFLVIFWYYAWPLPVTISLVAAATRETKLKIFAGYFLIIIVLGLLATIFSSAGNLLEILWLWFLTNFPASVLLLAFLNRRVQAVGPLVLTFMIVAVTGLVLMPTFVINNGGVLEVVVAVGVALGLGGGGIYIALLILGFVAFGALGWLALKAIAYWYRRKNISEQSITIDLIWLLFGIFQAVGLIFEGDHWFLASLLSFGIYKGVSWVGFWLARRYTPSQQQYPGLLVLRVFSLGKRSERLFDQLAMHWRFLGSIRLIAGPDLAATTIEPHEFLDFLSGKLARRFIDGARTLDLCISQMDLRPDHDGQFRVNDFFCYDNTWRMVLSRLARESDVIMMDLRGFSSQNAGVIYEIGELIDLVPLERVVFVVDDSTDEPLLRQVMQQAWNQMKPESPNRSSATGTLSLLRLQRLGERDLQRLLRVVSRAVQPVPEIQTMTGSSASSLTRS
ncbi:MAG TPA: hypothetical protein VFY25_02435 [Anaerolineales bacterium]|nr:hypothetical protein [Anaerolineales bacterium]